MRTVLPLLIGLLFVLPAKANDFSPHPACLDLDLQQPARHGFLAGPLPLTGCGSDAEGAPVFDHLGFVSNERPRDAAGRPAGAVYYQRIVGRPGEVVYV